LKRLVYGDVRESKKYSENDEENVGGNDVAGGLFTILKRSDKENNAKYVCFATVGFSFVLNLNGVSAIFARGVFSGS